MKQEKKDLLIAILVFTLAWSIILNLLQGEQVSRLLKEIEDMEYLQTVLSSHIDELETNEDINEVFENLH